MHYGLTIYPALSGTPQRHTRQIPEREIESLSWSTGPGGFLALQLKLADPGSPAVAFLSEPSDIRGYFHVRLRAGSFVVYEGRLQIRSRPGGVVRGFTCQGYGTKDGGMSDHVYYATDATMRTSGYCLQAIIGNAAPLVAIPNIDLWDDPGVSHTLGDFDSMTPQQVLDQLAQEGSGSLDFDFSVWEDGAARYIARTQPTYPDYLVTLDEDVDIEEDYSTIWSTVQINYSIPGSPPTPTSYVAGPDALTEQTYIPRDTLLSAPAQAAVPVEAVANLALAAGSAPKTAFTIHVHPEKPLRNRFGGDVPHHRYRFGQWIQIGADGPLAMILHTDHEWATEECTIQAGALPSDWENKVDDTRGWVNQIRSSLSPVTGAPL